ncbi:EF-P beta-lysylation protein EpmB [Pasteurellaceae bacterium 20609_3]|uniref:EF-P beta-lysylation protein EpmB n=1 Tax=Spirabiliibacterium mucosae TaxID=28156 RepID=UPI001AAC7CF3|nr:EF-P beta-lysylation protein EpmB [Spirabiliibacterium mucosae]MBE2899113.1 EF-P beta-lysylation protein EpmB [Spirabiliibacterium mucosae]
MQNSEELSWQQSLKQAIKSPEALLTALEIPHIGFERAIAARKLFPLLAPLPFVARMEKGNPHDPLFLQVMSGAGEFEHVEGFVTDPLEEHDAVRPGLLHKYHNRVLMMVKGGCAVNCRYCFRRHFPYQDHQGTKAVWQGALDYIAEHGEINEVIFSGGDPLMANDAQLDFLITALEAIAHVNTLRIHTRLPVVIPQRVTTALCDRLHRSRLHCVLVTHINHPNEMDDALRTALLRLKQADVVLLNQSVLLKGVNDNAAVLRALSVALFDAGVLPYYLHLLDKVAGAAHFYVDDATALSLYQQLQASTSGYLVPRLAREIAHQPNKTLITPANSQECAIK